MFRRPPKESLFAIFNLTKSIRSFDATPPKRASGSSLTTLISTNNDDADSMYQRHAQVQGVQLSAGYAYTVVVAFPYAMYAFTVDLDADLYIIIWEVPIKLDFRTLSRPRDPRTLCTSTKGSYRNIFFSSSRVRAPEWSGARLALAPVLAPFHDPF